MNYKSKKEEIIHESVLLCMILMYEGKVEREIANLLINAILYGRGMDFTEVLDNCTEILANRAEEVDNTILH